MTTVFIYGFAVTMTTLSKTPFYQNFLEETQTTRSKDKLNDELYHFLKWFKENVDLDIEYIDDGDEIAMGLAYKEYYLTKDIQPLVLAIGKTYGDKFGMSKPHPREPASYKIRIAGKPTPKKAEQAQLSFERVMNNEKYKGLHPFLDDAKFFKFSEPF